MADIKGTTRSTAVREKVIRLCSFQSNSVFYRLTVAFSLLFLGSLLAFVFLGVSSNLFGSKELLYCLLGMFVVSLGAYVILRQIAQGIMNIEARLAGKQHAESFLSCQAGESELNSITRLTEEMAGNLAQVRTSLSQRIYEIEAIRDLSSLDSRSADPQTLVSLAMEKALAATGATGGAVLLISDEEDDGRAAVASCMYQAGKCIVRSPAGLAGLAGSVGELAHLHRQGLLLDRNNPLLEKYFSVDCGGAAVVPFSLGKKRSAVAVLTVETSRDWDRDVLNFLTALFHTIGSSLKMNELSLREQDTSRELHAVLQMLRFITTSEINESDLFKAIAASLFELFPAQWLGLARFDQRTGELCIVQDIHKNTKGLARVVKLDRGTSLFQRAIDMMGRLDCDDLDKVHTYYEKEIFNLLRLRSCMIHSLHINGRILGSICLGGENGGTFSIRDKKYFSQIASATAIAFEQNRLLLNEKRKSSELEILNQIGVVLTSSAFDTKRMLQQILDMVVRLAGAEVGTVMLLDHNLLTVLAIQGAMEKNIEGVQIRMGTGICGRVATTGEAMVMDEFSASVVLPSEIDELAGIRTRNALCTPMISNGRVVGVFQLVNKIEGFNSDDLQTMKAVSSSTAIALDNNRLYNETTRLADKERILRTIFQKYVPKEIVAGILEKDEHEHMGMGERKTITVFIIDIRGYSEMSKVSSTEAVIEVLNYFL